MVLRRSGLNRPIAWTDPVRGDEERVRSVQEGRLRKMNRHLRRQNTCLSLDSQDSNSTVQSAATSATWCSSTQVLDGRSGGARGSEPRLFVSSASSGVQGLLTKMVSNVKLDGQKPTRSRRNVKSYTGGVLGIIYGGGCTSEEVPLAPMRWSEGLAVAFVE